MLRIQKSLIIVSALPALLLLAGCRLTNTTGATSTPSTTVNTGSVALHTDTSLYQTGDSISVTLSNGSNQTIYFPDHQTNCTVILLQRSKAQPLADEGGPVGINPCQLAIATRIHSLGPGQRLVVRLVAPKSGWPTGLYIATLSYRLSPSAGSPIPLASPAFAVGPRAPQP